MGALLHAGSVVKVKPTGAARAVLDIGTAETALRAVEAHLGRGAQESSGWTGRKTGGVVQEVP